MDTPAKPSQGLLLALPEVKEGEYETVDNVEDLVALIAELRAAGSFAFDVETTGKDPVAWDLVGLSFSRASGTASYIPVGHRGGRQIP